MFHLLALFFVFSKLYAMNMYQFYVCFCFIFKPHGIESYLQFTHPFVSDHPRCAESPSRDFFSPPEGWGRWGCAGSSCLEQAVPTLVLQGPLFRIQEGLAAHVPPSPCPPPARPKAPRHAPGQHQGSVISVCGAVCSLTVSCQRLLCAQYSLPCASLTVSGLGSCGHWVSFQPDLDTPSSRCAPCSLTSSMQEG